MSRTQTPRSHAPAPVLLAACALLATGCLGDLFHVSPAPVSGPAAPASPGSMSDLWDLAPADAVEGTVLHDGVLARVLALVADPDHSPARAAFDEVVRERSELPFDPLSPEAWAGAGLDPQRGAASFSFADRKRGMLLVLPVTDRARFRRAFDLVTRLEGGREVDQLDDETRCEPAAGRYLCAHTLAEIAAAAAPHASPLAASARAVDEHGEIELYVSREAPAIARFNHGADSPGWVTAVTGTLRLRDDGVTLRLHATGSLATPAARAFYAGLTPPELVALAADAPAVGSLHVDPAAFFPPSAALEPEVRSELVEQLTGDVVVIPSGSGFANATVILKVNDVPRVEAFVKKRCAEEAARKERRPLGGFKVEAHGCAAVFDSSKLLVPLGFPAVPIVATVADGRLVLRIGDAGHAGGYPQTPGRPGANPRTPSAPQGREGGDAARALDEAATLLFVSSDVGIGPDVGAGALFRAAIPIVGGRVATSVEAWNYASAHFSQARLRARVTDEEADMTLDLTSFAADPEAARAAYGAALGQRFAGEDTAYRAALASIEQRFPGTRAARRAAEVRKGAPSLGAGVALMATLALARNARDKKK